MGNLRALSALFPNDPRVTEIVGQLAMHSPAFATLWARYEVRLRTSEDKRLFHPQVGEMRLHYEAFTVTSARGQQLFVYSAEPGTPSADALILLRGIAAEALADRPLPYERRTVPTPLRTPRHPVDSGEFSRGRRTVITRPARLPVRV
ncbi:hypothetical protein J2Z21_009506 [Streptomyces griseochromogenes]|uniref:MmyB-like transcription regulator ligand binding domain-containing protein n=1 Tax=Streptomyces griseochromogenes TaxID=68214 RepID=A0A1B1B068_9ACTN|nr:hypothetical protein [Streptomyces griseochromogenes]ANP52209.1 hypothetical protein AVL59_24015 [Streptomyces griseochromogenes]MBP2056488.1 hypothetical protein [Streptomyces griseochromogenes]